MHNILYLNKKLFQFNKITSPECTFCKCEEETTIYLFYICRKTQVLWTQLIFHLKGHLNLQHLTPRSAFFGFLDNSDKDYLMVKHFLLLFKYYIYNATDLKYLVFEALMKNIKNFYDIADQYPHKKKNS